MTQSSAGFAYGVAAYLCWGLFPLYWTLLEPSGPTEILAQRVVWSLLFVGLLATALRLWPRIRAVIRNPRQRGYVAVGAVALSLNWGFFIYGVNNDRVIEVSLGYFINPLVTVFLGVLVLKERLRPWQWFAVAVSFCAVVILTIDYGRLPYAGLAVALSFGVYALVKKQVALGTVEGLAVETLFLLPFAVGFIVWLMITERATVGYHGGGHLVLIVMTGLVTAIPLLLFGAAAPRLSMTSIGLLQYLAPILQFLTGLFVFGETMTQVRWIGFGLVWFALAIFTVEALAHRRRALGEAARGSAL